MFRRARAARERVQLEKDLAARRSGQDQALREFVRGLIDEEGALRESGKHALVRYAGEHGYVDGHGRLDGARIPADVMESIALGLAGVGEFIAHDSDVILKAGEVARWVAAADLLKEVVEREYRGGSRGVSVPLGHGVRYRTSAIRGQLVAVGKHWEAVDRGQLTITDQRVLFTGARRTLEFQFSKLVNLRAYADAIDLGVTNRQATSTFHVMSPVVVATIIRASLPAGTAAVNQPTRGVLPEQAASGAAEQAPSSSTSTAAHDAQLTLPAVPPDSARSPSATEWWPVLLTPSSGRPWLGELLSSHPLAAEKTRVAIGAMTVPRLVLIANVQHNRCRRAPLKQIERADRARAAEMAWDQLLRGLSGVSMRPSTAWTGTIKLLTPSAEAALEQIQAMGIVEVIDVCQRLIQFPYAEARERGIT